MFSGEHFEEEDAEAVDVGFMGVFSVIEDFGGPIADGVAGNGGGGGVYERGEGDIGNGGFSGLGDEDVG